MDHDRLAIGRTPGLGAVARDPGDRPARRPQVIPGQTAGRVETQHQRPARRVARLGEAGQRHAGRGGQRHGLRRRHREQHGVEAAVAGRVDGPGGRRHRPAAGLAADRRHLAARDQRRVGERRARRRGHAGDADDGVGKPRRRASVGLPARDQRRETRAARGEILRPMVEMQRLGAARGHASADAARLVEKGAADGLRAQPSRGREPGPPGPDAGGMHRAPLPFAHAPPRWLRVTSRTPAAITIAASQIQPLSRSAKSSQPQKIPARVTR